MCTYPRISRNPAAEVMHALMRERPLATLVTLCESGLVANHIPVETLSEPAPLGMIRGHVARANPLWREYRAGSEALAIFQGPQAYISPSFYPAKRDTGEVVPTWNYAVVQARGTFRFVQDSGVAAGIGDALDRCARGIAAGTVEGRRRTAALHRENAVADRRLRVLDRRFNRQMENQSESSRGQSGRCGERLERRRRCDGREIAATALVIQR